VTSVVAARRNLHRLLFEEITDAQVTFGYPLAYEELRVVALMGVEDVDEEAVELGNQRRNEEYVVTVGVKVHDPAADDAGDVDAAGFSLASKVADVVHANGTLDGAVRFAQPIGIRGDGALPADPSGFGILLTVRVRCQARIQRSA
jgi:hypothetical protein